MGCRVTSRRRSALRGRARGSSAGPSGCRSSCVTRRSWSADGFSGIILALARSHHDQPAQPMISDARIAHKLCHLGALSWGEDTIVALSTATGVGAIGIVRMSGPAAVSIAESVFRPGEGPRSKPEETHRLLYGHVVDPRDGQDVDEVLLAVMRAPHSYTREDVVEVHCHGGVAAQRAVLRLLAHLGARLAEPGEFTRRAFLNGRIDLAQAESVAAIVVGPELGGSAGVGAAARGRAVREAPGRPAITCGATGPDRGDGRLLRRGCGRSRLGSSGRRSADATGGPREAAADRVRGPGAGARRADGHRRQAERGQEFAAQRPADARTGDRVGHSRYHAGHGRGTDGDRRDPDPSGRYRRDPRGRRSRRAVGRGAVGEGDGAGRPGAGGRRHLQAVG